jgi:hypothetical protein
MEATQMSRKPQMFDKYDRPTIHYFIEQRKQAAKEMVEAAIEDYKDSLPQPEPVDFDGMPLNYEERAIENRNDYLSFLRGDDQEVR